MVRSGNVACSGIRQYKLYRQLFQMVDIQYVCDFTIVFYPFVKSSAKRISYWKCGLFHGASGNCPLSFHPVPRSALFRCPLSPDSTIRLPVRIFLEYRKY